MRKKQEEKLNRKLKDLDEMKSFLEPNEFEEQKLEIEYYFKKN